MGDDAKYRASIPDADFFKGLIPCQAACPVHTDAGRYVQLIAQGEFEQAYFTASSPNPFASVCGRVCAAPCEDRCRRGLVDRPVSIRALKGFVCELYGPESASPVARAALASGTTEPGNKVSWHLPILAESRKQVGAGKKVAVIGAGPAGLSCAHDLAVMGYQPTVFEASATVGGMMVLGIPEFRLNRELLQREIQTILDLGVEVKLNTPLSQTFGINELRQQGFESVFLAVGTQQGRDVQVEGSDLDGIVKAVDFLLNVNRGYKVTMGRRVVVIGGGFVAFDAARAALRTAGAVPDTEGTLHTALDAARAALRAGVEEVRIVSLESFAEMPVLRSQQGHEEFEEAQHEGIVFQPQRGMRRFLGESGHVKAIELIGVSRTYDEKGRFAPVYDPEIQETIETDLAILAIGQRADLSFLKPENGVTLTPQGTAKVDPETLATSSPGIFAGGDAAFGPRNLIEAVANGKLAARSIDNYLRGKNAGPQTQISFRKLPTRGYRMPEDYEKFPRWSPPTLPLDRRTGITQVELTYSEADARVQAVRCLACHIQTIYDAEKCILCNRCVDVCPNQCLKLVPVEELGLENGSLSAVASHYGFDGDGMRSAAAMIKDESDCIRCGLCAIRCPTDAMTMEVLFYEEHEAVTAQN
jgi:NADPH-dependent glutamate synthase beta subunit-like oxidoreductase/NAD-dependent dihydropyrimidine dehydrogenase PreA subunit